MSSTAISSSRADRIAVSELFAPGVTYVVPIYQRNYAWQEEQIHQLIEDIRDSASDSEISEYFLGNLVVFEDPEHRHRYEVIDGQQRLTTLFMLLAYIRTTKPEFRQLNIHPLVYQSRAKATLALATLAESPSAYFERSFETVTGQDDGIVDGCKVIAQYDRADNSGEVFSQAFVEFLLNRVVLVRFSIPMGTDLNRYFEIMNTRGEQLKQEDIVKAKFIQALDAHERDCFAWMWDACADMDSYVQMSLTRGSTGLRSEVFGAHWSWLKPASFDDLLVIHKSSDDVSWAQDSQVGASASSMPLFLALQRYARAPLMGDDEDEENVRFNSSVGFSTFLLHVLRVLRRADEAENERQLDDKKLIARFDAYLAMGESSDRGRRARDFAYALLKCRFLFDNYVLKRESTTTPGDDGDWSLRRLVQGVSTTAGRVKVSPRYVASFAHHDAEDVPANKRIALLQAALRVTYTSPRTMHWISELLGLLWTKRDTADIDGGEALRALEAYARRKVSESFDGDILPTGFKINRIVFTYLDYLLSVEDRDLDFRFAFRNSVEHFFPQHIDVEQSGSFEPVGRDSIDLFGNLCLLSVRDNSKFSNSPPRLKIGFEKIVHQSPKLGRMAAVTRARGWSDGVIRAHHDEMIAVLRADLAKA